MQRIDLVGKRFGKLTVLSPAELNSDKHLLWRCQCDCGNIINVRSQSLRNGDTRSCGCLRMQTAREAHTKHGAYKNRTRRERLYNIYADMKQRCLNPNSAPYKDYGGRGISICEEWVNDYSAFRGWALANGYSPRLSIDRINNDGNYEPANCRWADAMTQAHNKRPSRVANRDPATGRFIKDRSI